MDLERNNEHFFREINSDEVMIKSPDIIIEIFCMLGLRSDHF